MQRREVYIRGIGLTLVAVSLILFMSIASFSPHDPPELDYPANNPPANICGIVGAYIGYLARMFFGTGSYLVAFAMAIIGALMVIVGVKRK